MSSRDPESLSSVHDNPFVKGFGNRGYARRNEPSPPLKSSNGNNIDTEEPEEYGVNSGFVNKLRSKFAKLENNQNKITLSKKSASVENLLSIGVSKSSNDVSRYRNRFGSAGRSSTDDSSISTGSKVELRKKVPTEPILTRPSSTEMTFIDRPPLPKRQPDVSRSTDFTRPVDRKRGKPPIQARKASSDTLIKRHSSTEIIPKVEHHDWKVAPDLEKIGRDNIVIIESSVPTKSRTEEHKRESVHESEDDYRHARPMKDSSKDENELPKPNTVSAFRSLFEKVNKTTDVVQTWRHLSPPRKSSSSDRGSPKVMSPVSSPRTPLSRKNDDNVFEETVVVVPDNNVINLSPRPFSESVPEVDTTSVSLKKSREMFQRENEPKSSGVTSPLVQHTMTPQHPLSNVFDSSAIKPDTHKSRKPKPKLHVDTNTHIPRDTLQLKHEGILKTYSGDMSPRAHTEGKSPAGFDHSSKEPVTSPVSRSSGKTSPRKTKIFDSSNIVKKARAPPAVPTSPGATNSKSEPLSDSVKQVEIKIKDAEKVTVDAFQPIPSKRQTSEPIPSVTTSGMKEIKPNVIPVKRNKGDKKKDNDLKPNNFSKEPNFPKPLTFEKADHRERKSPNEADSGSNGEAPVSGMSSFLAQRLNKSKTEQENQPVKNKAVHLANGSSPSPVPRKRQAPAIPTIVNGDIEMEEQKVTPPPLPVTPEPSLPKTNLDDIIGRKTGKKPQSATKMVFDSSKIVTKRKDPPKRKPPRQTLDQMNASLKTESAVTPVPKLDLTSITAENTNVTEYQEGYIPTVIKPCPFKFVGAEVTFEKTPYKRTRIAKAKISFAENATTTFEYEDEESALAQYLREHPEEQDEVRQQQEEIERSEQETDDLLSGSSSRDPDHDSAMKSNTVIGMPTGPLSSYKSKIQVPDFQFGMTPEPDDYYTTRQPEPEPESEEGRDLLPADDSQLDTFSNEVSKADMLF